MRLLQTIAQRAATFVPTATPSGRPREVLPLLQRRDANRTTRKESDSVTNNIFVEWKPFFFFFFFLPKSTRENK
jgi:hypothetical protein